MIIRNVNDGKPFMVVSVFNICILVAPLEDGGNPVPVSAIFQRDYKSYRKDTEMAVETITFPDNYWADPVNKFTVEKTLIITDKD